MNEYEGLLKVWLAMQETVCGRKPVSKEKIEKFEETNKFGAYRPPRCCVDLPSKSVTPVPSLCLAPGCVLPAQVCPAQAHRSSPKDPKARRPYIRDLKALSRDPLALMLGTWAP